MSNLWMSLLAAALGAIGHEIIHWHDLKIRLEEPELQQRLRSSGYWVATLAFSLFAIGVTFVLADRDAPPQTYLALAAGCRSIFVSLADTQVNGKKNLDLGEGEISGQNPQPSPLAGLRAYFA